jgi:3-deoxy-D-manno-octulosonate 8-phosphate phosphatase (KDO 8-P phosphatase)
MSELSVLEASFAKLGGVFVTPADVLARRLSGARGMIFDWDGVFNAGIKGGQIPSTFSEADSMGTNLLRYALWRRLGSLPVSAIITGEDNPGARAFATREHFSAVFQGVKHKAEAMGALCAAHGLEPSELICFFDDVNDLSMAADCAVRVLIRREASPLLQDHVVRHALCDYVTGLEAGRNAVREGCELLLGLLGEYQAAVASRVAWDERYRQYFTDRQSVSTALPVLG